MNAGELLERIENGETITSVSKEFGITRKTLSRRVKRLGYAYDEDAKAWYWPGEPEDEPKDVVIAQVGNNNINVPKIELADDNKDKTPKEHNNNPEPEDEGPDVFDRILKSEPKKNNKDQRGFYFEPEVINAIDQHVANKSKSEFVNAAVKQVLKSKGLL